MSLKDIRNKLPIPVISSINYFQNVVYLLISVVKSAFTTSSSGFAVVRTLPTIQRKLFLLLQS